MNKQESFETYENYKEQHYELLQRIKKALLLSGMSASELCRRTGIDKAHFSKVVNQEKNDAYRSFPSIALVAITVELNLSLNLSING